MVKPKKSVGIRLTEQINKQKLKKLLISKGVLHSPNAPQQQTTNVRDLVATNKKLVAATETGAGKSQMFMSKIKNDNVGGGGVVDKNKAKNSCEKEKPMNGTGTQSKKAAQQQISNGNSSIKPQQQNVTTTTSKKARKNRLKFKSSTFVLFNFRL